MKKQQRHQQLNGGVMKLDGMVTEFSRRWAAGADVLRKGFISGPIQSHTRVGRVTASAIVSASRKSFCSIDPFHHGGQSASWPPPHDHGSMAPLSHSGTTYGWSLGTIGDHVRV